MKRKRHTPEEIIKKLREAAALKAGGQSVEEVCKKLEVSPATYHRWQQKYGGVKEDAVKRLKELEKENARLKKLVADQALDMAILKAAMGGCSNGCRSVISSAGNSWRCRSSEGWKPRM